MFLPISLPYLCQFVCYYSTFTMFIDFCDQGGDYQRYIMYVVRLGMANMFILSLPGVYVMIIETW